MYMYIQGEGGRDTLRNKLITILLCFSLLLLQFSIIMINELVETEGLYLLAGEIFVQIWKISF